MVGKRGGGVKSGQREKKRADKEENGIEWKLGLKVRSRCANEAAR